MIYLYNSLNTKSACLNPISVNIGYYSDKSDPKPSFISSLNKSSLYIGMKKGFEMELLPLKVTLFLDNPIVRILRVIGGLSVLLNLFIINKIILIDTHIFFLYILNIIALIHIIQMVIINLIKFVYGINKLIRHKKDFEVRNSPIDKLASISVKLIYCWKVGCTVGGSTIGFLGGTIIVDSIFESSGYNKVFQPYIKKGLNIILGTTNQYSEDSKIILEYNRYISENKNLIKDTDDLDTLSKNLDNLSNSNYISKEDIKIIKDEINKIQHKNQEKINYNESKIIEAYKKVFIKKEK